MCSTSSAGQYLSTVITCAGGYLACSSSNSSTMITGLWPTGMHKLYQTAVLPQLHCLQFTGGCKACSSSSAPDSSAGCLVSTRKQPLAHSTTPKVRAGTPCKVLHLPCTLVRFTGDPPASAELSHIYILSAANPRLYLPAPLDILRHGPLTVQGGPRDSLYSCNIGRQCCLTVNALQVR